MELKNIFFSYSRADAAAFALKLAVDLQEKGFNVWIDQQDIRAGSEWDLEIEKALETCDCLLFIESENSVVSTNVLDEVYYAIDQHKIVIPVIYQDSKTPFRINRLQHIDFSRNYDTGLENLTYELKNRTAKGSGPEVSSGSNKKSTRSFVLKPINFVIIGLLAVIVTLAFLYITKEQPSAETAASSIPKVPVTDTLINKLAADSSSESMVTPLKNQPARIEGQPSRKPVSKTAPPRSRELEQQQPLATGKDLLKQFKGKWNLEKVEPKSRLHRGTLIIDALDNNNVKILTNFQFYYIKSNDTAFFSVFNGYAGCASCELEKDMALTDNDVAFGTIIYKILRKDQEGEGKAGDTVMTAAPNTSIAATVTMHLAGPGKVTIKVQKSIPTPIAMGFVVNPFVYTFHFTKRDY